MAVLEIERHGHVTVLTLNRPESRNALSPELAGRLAQAWDAIKADPDVRVAVLTAAPGPVFCAGFDLALSIPLLTGTREPEDEWDHALAADWNIANRACLRGVDLGKPLIVAANGHAVAGGFELLLAGDLRIVAAGAKLGLSEVKIGLIPGMGGTAHLRHQLPPAIAAEILLTGQNISAERALDDGFVNRVAPADDVLITAMELADTIAANPPLAVQGARDVMRRARDLSSKDALAVETEVLERLKLTEDAVEGPKAFMEKRPPVFKGR